MASHSPEDSQRLAARIAGFTLLLLIASGLLSNFTFSPHLVIEGNPAATIQNILAHERVFRFGIATGIVMFNCDIVLAVALYALLRRINGPLALLGTIWRSANAIVLGSTIGAKLLILDLPKSSVYLAAWSAAQMQAVIKMLSGFQSHSSSIALIFFCLGAGVHSWLLYKSRYIPRILSGFYLFCCVQMLIFCFIFLIVPTLSAAVGWRYVFPDFFAELFTAFWLAFKGANIPFAKHALQT
jgi:Domain of unknown function (DUF4386)